MQGWGGRPGRNAFFGLPEDPFPGFGTFGGRPGSIFSSVFGGRNPFDDPFFANPFGPMMGPSLFGPGGSSSLFGEPRTAPFLEQAPVSKHRGPIIEELNSDDEDGEDREEGKKLDERNGGVRKHSRKSKQPYVQEPEEESGGEKKSRVMPYANEFMYGQPAQPQTHSYSFQSSSVTYGGPSGAYYTSSLTRRTGADGVSFEEHKEADTSTGKATHRVSRGIHDKGHSLTRKLHSDGTVNSVQTLHNLDEDDLSGFEESWKHRAKKHLPDWNSNDLLENGHGSSSHQMHGGPQTRGWALPAAQPAFSQPNPRQPRVDSFRAKKHPQ